MCFSVPLLRQAAQLINCGSVIRKRETMGVHEQKKKRVQKRTLTKPIFVSWLSKLFPSGFQDKCRRKLRPQENVERRQVPHKWAKKIKARVVFDASQFITWLIEGRGGGNVWEREGHPLLQDGCKWHTVRCAARHRGANAQRGDFHLFLQPPKLVAAFTFPPFHSPTAFWRRSRGRKRTG